MAKVNKELVRKVYRFLIMRAMIGELTCYEEIAIKFDLPAVGNSLGKTLSPILEHIFLWCKRRGQPHLTSIVVRKSGADAGIPGRGFWVLALKGSTFEDIADATSQEKIAKQMKVTLTSAYQKQVFDYWKI